MSNAPRPSDAADPSWPHKLGRYELEERLGGDEAVETFKARVRGLAGFDRIFAVKCLHRPRGIPVNLNDPFIKTARRLASMNDPRVARVLDADVIDGIAVAVTEFVHGLDLDRFRECAQYAGVLATGSDETAQKWQKIIAYLGSEVAGGLAALHGLAPALVHGRLCPRNVAATARGGVKILDAGLGLAVETPARDASKRSLAYAGGAAATPSPEGDIRALGAMLFELATGELPPDVGASALARKALDALWPAMSDFVASLLSDDPKLRPSAAEAAKVLGEHWADIPDASMVSEVATLVRNFSAFVADAGLQNTPPIVAEPSARTVADDAPPAPSPPAVEVLAPSRGPATPAGGTMEEEAVENAVAEFGDEATVARTSDSYAAALFQAVPPQVEDEVTSRKEAPRSAVNATLLSYPALAPPPPVVAPAPHASAAELPALVQAAEASAPIPELADWGARALAALGDQAGVDVARLMTPPAPAQDAQSSGPPPPPVSDPTIEEAFAFAPAAEPVAEPAEEPAGQLVEATAFDAPDSAADEPTSPVSALLEDDLVEEPPAVPRQPDSAPTVSPPEVRQQVDEDEQSVARGATPGQAAEREAPDRASEAHPEERSLEAEWAPPHLAHAPTSPPAERQPEVRSAARSSAGQPLAAIDAELLSIATRKRRVTLAVAAVILLAIVGASLRMLWLEWWRPHGSTAAPGAHPPTLVHARPAAAPQAPPSKQSREPVKVAAQGKPAPGALDATRVARPQPSAHAAAADGVAAVAAATPVKTGSAGPGITVSVSSTPAGATVWIDGEERGTTPCSVTVAPGGTRVTLVHAGYQAKTTSLDSRASKTLAVALEAAEPPLAGEARFRAECKTTGKLPIVVDGHDTGVLCPYSKLRVEPGVHRIGLFIPATGTVHEKEITLPAGVRSVVFAD